MCISYSVTVSLSNFIVRVRSVGDMLANVSRCLLDEWFDIDQRTDSIDSSGPAIVAAAVANCSAQPV